MCARSYQMISSIVITPEIRAQAVINAKKEKQRILASEYSRDHSITDGEGTVIGAIGEILWHIENKNALRKNCTDYDFTLFDQKFEIKTRTGNFPPQPSFIVLVNQYYVQKCDYYAFFQVNDALTIAYSLGFIYSKGFWRRCEKKNKGSKGWKYRDKTHHLFKESCGILTLNHLVRHNTQEVLEAPAIPF